MITKKQFIQWLESRKPLAKVGEIRSCGHCPIANYLREKEPDLLQPWADPLEGWAYGVHWPAWTDKFVGSVDARKSHHITAKTCLKIIRELQ